MLSRTAISMFKPIVAATAAMLLGCGVAHADDTSYQDYLVQHGYGATVGPLPGPNGPKVTVPGMWVDWPKAIADGHMLCDRMHSGSSYKDLDAQYGAMPYWHPISDAAQQELCPDTLRR
jgi:hypothetical protein